MGGFDAPVASTFVGDVGMIGTLVSESEAALELCVLAGPKADETFRF